jgi:hypothetical protein
MTNNISTRVEEIQKKISRGLGLKENQIVFELNVMPNYVDLDLFTINSIHKQQFFFHSTEGRDEIEALELMLKHVENQLIIDDSFTFQWKLKGSTEIHQSYFRGKNIMDALDKFYFGRSISSTTIYSIVLNPLA